MMLEAPTTELVRMPLFCQKAIHSPSLSQKTSPYSAQRSFFTGWTQREWHNKSFDPLQNPRE